MGRPRDTSDQAWQQQFEELRRMTPQQRLAAGASMSDELRALVAAGIRARHPEYTEIELRDALAAVLLSTHRSRAKSRRRIDTGG